MPFGNIIFNLPREEKTLIRKLEKAHIKLNHCLTAISFNKACIKEGLLPNYHYYYYYYY